jgi:hypothetical protein
MPGVVKSESREVSLLNSLIPKLIDTTVTPAVLFAVCTAVIKLARTCESEFPGAASITSILAPGAIAWAHSTSSDSSCAQSLFV